MLRLTDWLIWIRKWPNNRLNPPLSLYLSNTHTNTHTHTHSLSHYHTLTHTLSLYLTHKHTHTYKHTFFLSLSLSLSHSFRIKHRLFLSLTHSLSRTYTSCYTLIHALSATLSHTLQIQNHSICEEEEEYIWMSLNLKRKLLVNNYRAWEETNLFSRTKIYLTLNVGKKLFLFLHLLHKKLIIYATKPKCFLPNQKK